jgi:hypothetical protein
MAERRPGEGEVRRCLTDQAAAVGAARADLAGIALARGRRARRRRQAAGLVGVVGATVLATGLFVQVWQGPSGGEIGPATGLVGDPVTGEPDARRSPTQSPRLADPPALAAGLAVDLIGEGASGRMVLATGAGDPMDLGPVEDVVSAHRVGQGWAVVSGQPGTTRLWWVSPQREPVPLLAGMDSVVVERARVAWRRGALLATGSLSGRGELERRAGTAAPAGDGQPVGFLGSVVLLARTEPAGWDIWQPARGDYAPAWTDRLLRVYGAVPGGQAAVGLVPPEPGAGGPCLARLEVGQRLVPVQVGCPTTGPAAAGPAALSPDGRWLIAGGRGDGAGPVLVDVVAALAERPGAVVRVPGLARPAGRPVWLDPEQALVPTADGLVRVVPEALLAGGPGGVQVVASGAGLLVVEPM